jgi:hypothetical protein
VGPVIQVLVVQAQFLAQVAVVVHRVAAIRARHINDEDQETGTLDVAQEIVAEADPGMGAVNQARDIRDAQRGVVIKLQVPMSGFSVVNG